MFRQRSLNSKCFAVGVCALFVLAEYPYFNNISYRLSSNTINKTLQNPLVHRQRQNPRTDLQNYIDDILDATRTMIKIQTWNYNFSHSGVRKLEDLVMESGGTPVRSIVVSTWRSGSTFLGELINTVPGSFYSYEPLMMFDVYKQIRGFPHAARATEVLKNILKCNFNNETDLEKYFKFVKNRCNTFRYNKAYWGKCTIKQELCFDADFTAKFCKLFPFQTMKLNRLRLPLIKNIFEDEELNVKAVLLVRDPRGVMQSRRYTKDFCSAKKVPDCAQAGLVCSDMITDYKAAVNFLQKYPNRLMVLRFEDLAFNLEATTLQLLKFLGLEPTQLIHKFLNTHTIFSVWDHDPYSTVRVSKNIPFKWSKTMKFNAVKEIQETCKEAMSLWGYGPAHNASHMSSKKFNPLLPYSIKQNT